MAARKLATGEFKDKSRRVAIDILQAANAVDEGDYDRAYVNLLQVGINNRIMMATVSAKRGKSKKRKGKRK